MDEKLNIINQSGALQMNRSQYIGVAELLMEKTLKVVWEGDEEDHYEFEFLASNQNGETIPGKKTIIEVHFNEPVYSLSSGQSINRLITEVYLPRELKVISSQMMAGATKLENIILPPTLEKIEEAAFVEANLRTVKIPDTIKEIGPYAFVMNQYANITLPSTVSIVGEGAFEGIKTLHYAGSLEGAPWGATEWIKD